MLRRWPHGRLGRHTVWLVCALLVPVGGALAQTESVMSENGFQPNRDYLSLQPWESIDTASGNVVLAFTDLQLPGNNGRSLRFQRTFNNTPTASDPRWRFSVSNVPMRVTTPTIAAGSAIPNSIAGERSAAPRFVMPDGSLLMTTFMTDPDTSPGQLASTTRWVTTPSFWRYDRLDRELYLPDGTFARYDSFGRLTYMSDRFGNVVTLAWTPGWLTVVQALGSTESRQVDIEIDDVTALPVRMYFESKVWTYLHHPSSTEVLTSVQPPDGRPWLYAYDGGRIARVTTPLGGTVEYEYGWKFFVTGQDTTESLVALVGRTTNSGTASDTWTFDYRYGAGGVLAGMIASVPASSTAPARRIEYGYGSVEDDSALAGGWRLINVSVFEGAAVSSVESDTRSYVNIPATRPSRVWYVPELARREVVRNGRSYETQYVYNLADTTTFADFHRPSEVIERTAGEARRRTTFVYQHLTSLSPYVVGLPVREDARVGSEVAVRRWSYDNATGFRTSETTQGSTTTFTSNAQGNVQRITKANGTWTEHTYSFGHVATTTSSEPGYVVTRAINPDGSVRYESQAGRTTTYQYDGLLRIRQVQPPGAGDAAITTYSDNAFGQSIRVQRGPSFVTTTTDGFGRVVGTVNSAGVRTSTEYDALGQRARVSLPFTGAAGPMTTFAYDVLGRVVRETNADGSSRTRTHGPGDTVVVHDESNRATTLTYHTFGHPDDGRLTGLVDANDQPWAYSYNVVGALAQVRSPDGLTRTWAYDPTTQRLLSETHPESGTVEYTSYDAAGVLKARRDANGTTFTYQHDGNDRVTQISAGGQVLTFTYEDGSDHRRTASSGSISTAFYYDASGRLGARDDSVGGQVYTRRFDYDTRDNLTLLTYPSGRRVRYDYDAASRITAVTDLTAGRVVVDDVSYHPSGALSSYRAGNNLTTNLTYHSSRYWVQSITVGPLQLGYAYDDVGNVTGISDARAGYGQSFTYDPLDRLESSTSMVLPSTTYTYDAHGNRTDADYNYVAGTLRLQRQGVRTFTYDANGNMRTSGANVGFTFTPDNRMASATVDGATTAYQYDADNWRARKSGPGSTAHYLRGQGSELLTEVVDTGLGTLDVRDHVYVGSRLVAVVNTSKSGSLCTSSIAPTSASPSAAGAPAITVGVTIQAGCAWTAVSGAAWVTVTAGAPGNGTGTVTLTVAANTEPTPRTAAVTIAGRTFTVEQAASVVTCAPMLSPTSFSAPEVGGSVAVAVTNQPGCAWTASSSAAWVTVSTGASGTGNGTVTLGVQSNPDAASRTAAVTIADRTFTVTQVGADVNRGSRLDVGERLYPNWYLQSPNGVFQLKYWPGGNLVLAGPSGAVRNSGVTTGSAYAEMLGDGRFIVYRPDGGVAWSAGSAGSSSAYYLTMQDDRNVVIYNSANHATWSWGTQCPYTVPAGQRYFTARSSGLTDSIAVTTEADCPYTATSSDGWLTVTSGATAGGPGTVTFSAASNTGTSPRQATIEVAGATVTVWQAGAPGNVGDRVLDGWELSPDQTLTSSNGQHYFKLFDSGVASTYNNLGQEWWRSGTTDGFGRIRMESGKMVHYKSNGTIGWTLGPGGSPGASLVMLDDGRAVIASAGGAVLWASTAPPSCAYDVWPTFLDKGPNDANDQITVTTGNSCSWAPSASAGWIHVTSAASGVGAAVVTFTLDDNWSGSSREGTITVGGRSTTVFQGGQRGVSDRLLPGERLYPGQVLRSPDERFELAFQYDGNLVLRGPWGYMWDSRTGGSTPGFATVQGDGNVVVYTSFLTARWSTGTSGRSGAWLVLQDDGNLVVYDDNVPIWSSGTGGY